MKTNIITFFLIWLLLPLTWITTTAQIDERFFGNWILETAEVRESEFNNPKNETKTVYTLENAAEMIYFDAITKMKFVQEQEQIIAELEDEQDAEESEEELTDLVPVQTPTGEFSFIATFAAYYENPVLQISDRYFSFADSSQPDAHHPNNQYNYEFLTPEKIVLISQEIFYSKDRMSMKAQLYLTLTRLTE